MGCFSCCFNGKSQEEDFDYVSYRPRNNNNTTKVAPDLTKDNNIARCTIDELKNKFGNQETGDPDSLTAMIPESQRGSPHPPTPLLTADGLIMPRKLHNPVLDNAERQNLHRELLFNQKIGKNVLNQKSELQRALEKHKTNIAKKEYETNMNAMSPELEKVIADRAKKRQEVNAGSTENEDDKGLSKEFLQARAKLKARSDVK
ncbi:protein FAM107B isoform X3 [Onthophagus taurus]|uniref:protein FAM107B isoform X3 n=1 Tax=Onthophagus taurus TaxID=166361 RepID=UPI000C1FE85C|nr:protein FAM107B isoform X1 [Onthophagus taurus]